MTKEHKYLYIFILFTYQISANAVEFKHFKLKGTLKEANEDYEQYEARSQAQRVNLNKSHTLHKAQNNNIIDNPSAVNSPLINDLTAQLSGSHSKIGQQQTLKLLKNYDMGGGVLNFSGFTWYKPMLNYQVYANRELAPHATSKKWIVHDTFTIYVEAATLLTTLKNNNLIEVSDRTIGAFSGITFSRVYHYYHFSNDYLDGLTSDYSKLFLSFNKFNNKGAVSLDEYEAIRKTDTFSFNAGGLIHSPLGDGTTLQAGVLVNTAFKKDILLQNVGPTDRTKADEFLRLTVSSQHNKAVGAHLSLQYDFFNLLKISLLSYDFEYEYQDKNELALTFYEKDKTNIISEGPAKLEFQSLLKGSADIVNWKKNITRLEDRLEENLSSRFGFLLFGTIKKRATEQIHIIKNGLEKTFFKHYSESAKYIQSLFSRFFQSIVHKIFDFEISVSNKAEMKKKFVIEYEQMKDLGAAHVDSETKFSIRLKHYFHVANTHRWYHRTFYKSAISHVKNLTNLSPELIKKVKEKELRGPLTLNSTIEINHVGLKYFNEIPEKKMIEISLNICKVRKYERDKFTDNKERKKLFRKRLRGSKRCAQKLITRYIDYIGKYLSFGTIDLMKFKKFTGYFFSKSRNLSDFKILFGEKNIFIHGDLRAKTNKGLNFQTYFKTGQFRGLGVIDKFKNENLITPVNTKRHD